MKSMILLKENDFRFDSLKYDGRSGGDPVPIECGRPFVNGPL